jgi:tetratricopeptide (TPR) repeat protein
LLFVCLIDSHDIPRDLLNYCKDSTVVDSFIYHLKKYSLITTDSSNPGQRSAFSLHKSTQEISLAYLTKVRDQAENQDAMKHILEAFEEHFEQVVNNEQFSKMDQLINHLKQFLQHKTLLNATANGVVESQLGCIYYYLGYYESALQLLNNSFINLKLDAENNQLQIARVLSHLGKVYRETGDFNKAIKYFKDSISIYEHYPNAILEIARTLGYLGYTYRNFSDFDNAKYFLKKALTIYKNHPESPVWTAWTLAHLGIIDREVGTYEDAKTRLEESLVIFKQVKNQKRISWVLGNLGRVYEELGYYEIAQKLLEEGLETHLQYFSENHSNVTWLLTSLGDVYCKLEKYQLAKNTHEKSLKIRNKLFGENSIKTLGTYGHLGDTYSVLGDLQKAKEYIEITRVAYEKHYGSNHLKTARVYRVLGKAYFLEGDLKKAEVIILKSLGIFKDKKHPGAYILFEDLSEINIIKSIQALKAEDSASAQIFYQKAQDNLKQAFEIIQTNFPNDSPHLKRIRGKIGNLRRNV